MIKHIFGLFLLIAIVSAKSKKGEAVEKVIDK